MPSDATATIAAAIKAELAETQDAGGVLTERA